MPRPAGSRNRDYEASRRALARAVVPHLLDATGMPATLKQLADAAGVTQPTLKHYFGDRDGVIEAAMRSVREDARRYIEGSRASGPSAARALEAELRTFVEAWRRFGVGQVFGAGTAVGLHSDRHGPVFVDTMLEPTLQAIERMLAELARSGRLRAPDPRLAALALLGPVVLALLHQDNLRGARCRPLDVDALVAPHVRGFLRGYGARGPRSA